MKKTVVVKAVVKQTTRSKNIYYSLIFNKGAMSVS